MAPLVARAQRENATAATEQKNYDQSRVGDSDPDRIVVPTNQVLSPIGKQVAYGGRPADLAMSPDGRWLAVLDRGQRAHDRSRSGKVVGRVPHKGGSYAGIVFTPDGERLLASSIGGTIGVFEVETQGDLNAAAADQTGRPATPRPRACCRWAWRSPPTARRCGPCSTCATRWPRSTWRRAR